MSPPAEDNSRRNSQLLKGSLDLCILVLLRDGPLYGYAVVDALRGRGIDLVAEGTVYPLLTRMEKAGVVGSFRAPSAEGPPRKYYELTKVGERELVVGIEQWSSVTAQVGALLGSRQQSKVDTKKGGVDANH